MFSPIACSIGAAARRRWCSALPPCGRWWTKLLPGAKSCRRPRLSTAHASRAKRRSRDCRRRSAIVAFSADEVYAIAELIRRQSGGAAVVLGALSPRTRNAQVALFQSGEVDYLVATDAIGMGLNLDVDHVAFASDRKFDGYQFRELNPGRTRRRSPAAQGGRPAMGRSAPPGGVRRSSRNWSKRWRATRSRPSRFCSGAIRELDFCSLGALQASLAASPNGAGLTRAPDGRRHPGARARHPR